MRIKFVDAGGIRTRLLYAGDPAHPPLLLIHGFGVSADTWLRNIGPLAEAFFVCAPDMVGHGFTDPVDFGGHAPHRQTVDHLCRLADTLGFDSFAVSGSSY
ncbi:MAG: alpha/beta fold hydrolase, partial [Planctomycetota bacterium]